MKYAPVEAIESFRRIVHAHLSAFSAPFGPTDCATHELRQRLALPTIECSMLVLSIVLDECQPQYRLQKPDDSAHAMSLPAAQARPMIDLGSIAGLHDHDHELRAYCLRCDRWAVLPLATLVSRGKGSLRLPFAVRCQRCGERGQLQVRPPMPAWTNTNGWMELR